MKTYQLLARLSRPLARMKSRIAQSRRGTVRFVAARRGAVRFVAARRGTVIIVVLALLGMLALMGFFVFAFTASENQSATYFAGAAKVNLPVGLDANLFFNDALRQIIIGPSISEKQSVLWGGRSSLLPTMWGRDLSPYNGAGVNLIWTGTTSVDQNYDAVADDGTGTTQDNRALTFLNFSPSAAIAWQANTTFVAGAYVRSVATQTGLLYIATAGGASGATEPIWPALGATVTDGTVTWIAARSISFNNYPPSTNPLAPNLFPDLDVNATYPDINSPFLSYDALIPNPASATLLTRLITPSFHRPQYLRNATGAVTNPVPVASWYTDPLTAPRVLYPHVEHTAIDSSGNITNVQRFVTNTHTDAVITSPFLIPGDGATPAPAEGVWTTPGGGPISYTVDTDNDGIPDSNYMDLGFPLMTDPSGNQFVAMAAIQIKDTDALLNLNVHSNRSGQAAVPSPNNFGGAATFLSRSNLGVSASEVNVEWALNARPVAVGADFPGTLAALNSALVQYVSFFRAPPNSNNNPTNNFDPTAGAVSYELANMDLWNILNGRPQLTPSATPLLTAPTVTGSSLPGRWGENLTRLDPNVNLVLTGVVVPSGLPTSTDPWPLPGTSGVDDNFNSPESGTFTDLQGIVHPAFVTPLDFFGAGSSVNTSLAPPPPAEGKSRLMVVEGAQNFVQYSNYFTNPTVQWTTFFSGGLMAGGGPQLLIDEPDETFTEPSAVATQSNDAIYGASENTLQLSGSDFTALGNPARTASLASFNLVANARAAQIRQRLTSTSWDLKSFGKEFLGVYTPGTNDARRLWEFTDSSAGATGLGPFRFPPDFGGVGVLPPPALNATANTQYPLRMDLAHLLWTLADPKQQLGTNAVLLPQRPLSINHLVEQVQLTNPTTGTPYTGFRFRPLTPHPTATSPAAPLPSTPITPPAHLVDGIGYAINRPEQLTAGNVQQQEWLARYDRQRLARDIYTLLYLTGGGNDSSIIIGGTPFNYTTASNQPVGGVRPVYTDDQLREMAQFAVNLVDALDPDTNITVFEYDKDLSNGWNLDDNPYDNGAGDTAPPFNMPISLVDRGVVYGVERQQLAFNEAQVTFAECVAAGAPINHGDTQYDEGQGYWGFFFAELENVSPFPVTFATEGWEIAIKESPTVVPSTFYGQEMRMIIGAGQTAGVPAGPNARFTVGTAGATQTGASYVANMNNALVPPAPFPSWFVVDPNHGDPTYGNGPYDNHGTNPGFPISPRAAYVNPTTTNPNALDLDMILQPSNCFVMGTTTVNGITYDGATVTGTPTTPAGTQFVQFANWPSILPTTNITVRIELRRRADLNRQPPLLPNATPNIAQEQDNPWIVVDYVDVPVGKLMLTPASNSVQIQAQLGPGGPGSVVSTERTQPLYQTMPTTPPPTPAPNGGATTDKAPLWQGNSLGQDNDVAGFDPGTVSGTPKAASPHSLYQPHYDRDFSSIIELFNVPLWGPYGPGSDVAVSASPNSGLAYRMASRTTDTGTPIGQETLAGGDWNTVAYSFSIFASPPPPQVVGHSLGFGTAGYRFQHPEGGDSTNPNPTTDFTENRWHRVLNLVEVPTRSHRQLEEPPYQITAGTINGSLGFYRTPGKINLNTLRHPDVLGGLLDDGDVYSLSYSAPFPAGLNFPANLSVPLSLPDQNSTGPTADTFQAPSPIAGQVRDWWKQFIMARDGIDPLPTTAAPTAGTGLPLPGLPRAPSGTAPPAGSSVTAGSHPFRGLGFSPYANAPLSTSGGVDANRYNGTLDSTLLRALPGDPVTPTAPATLPTSPDVRRRLFELGTAAEHFGDSVDYATRNRVLSKILQNTTTRSNVFLVWIQIDYFQARDVSPPNGVVRVGAKLPTSPGYRAFFVIDRSQAMSLMSQQFLPAVDPATGNFVFSLDQSFNYQSLVLFQQRIQ